jgi:hypothetical protein
MRFLQVERVATVNEKEELLVLVGGLGSGEWRYWALQWAARNVDPDVRGRKLWTAQESKPLGPVLQTICGQGQFRIEMQHGARPLGCNRRLRVDENGIPLDQRLRKSLKRGLRAAERKALNPPPGVVVSRFGTRWQSVLDWEGENDPKKK